MKNVMKIVISTIFLFIVIMLINHVQAAGINGTTIVLNAGHGGNDEQEVKQQKEQIMVSMPLWAFIALEAGIIIVEATILVLVFRKKLFSKNH